MATDLTKWFGEGETKVTAVNRVASPATGGGEAMVSAWACCWAVSRTAASSPCCSTPRAVSGNRWLVSVGAEAITADRRAPVAVEDWATRSANAA